MSDIAPGWAWLRAFDAEVSKSLPLSESARWLLDAHATFESGWGASRAFRKGFNFANITAGPYWHGATFVDVGGDTEYKPGNPTPHTITQVWRVYPTLGDAIEDYWAFLGWPRYVAARNCMEQGDVAGFVGALHDGGYFTEPPALYFQGMQATLHKVTSTLRGPPPDPTPPLAA